MDSFSRCSFRIAVPLLLLLLAGIGPGALLAEHNGRGEHDAGEGEEDDGRETSPPCHDLTLATDEGVCWASGDSIDESAFDPNGRTPILEKDPSGPYLLGDTLVTFTVQLPRGPVTTCSATVTVEDRAAPVVECNAPDSITPPEAPISFTATATDNCSVASVEVGALECWKVNPRGKRLDRASSCVATADGDTVTIVRSGGAGSRFAWEATATDGSGNSIVRACETAVVSAGAVRR